MAWGVRLERRSRFLRGTQLLLALVLLPARAGGQTYSDEAAAVLQGEVEAALQTARARGKPPPPAVCDGLILALHLAPGSGRLFGLARCQELSGRLTEALSSYQLYLRLAAAVGASDLGESAVTQNARRQQIALAHERRAALSPQVARLRLRAVPSAQPLSCALDGEPLPNCTTAVVLVDPGEHQVTTIYPQSAPLHEVVSLHAGEVLALQLRPPSPAPSAAPRSPPRPPDPAAQRRKAAIALWALGGATLLSSLTTFGLMLSARDERDRLCPNNSGCDQAQVRGRSLADSSSGLFVSTVGLAVIGGVLWAVAQRLPEGRRRAVASALASGRIP